MLGRVLLLLLLGAAVLLLWRGMRRRG